MGIRVTNRMCAAKALLFATMVCLPMWTSALASDPSASPFPSFLGDKKISPFVKTQGPRQSDNDNEWTGEKFRKELLPRIDELVFKALRNCPALKRKLSEDLELNVLEAVGRALDGGVRYLPPDSEHPADDKELKTPSLKAKPVRGLLLGSNRVFYVRLDNLDDMAVHDLSEELKAVFRQAISPLGVVIDIRGTHSGSDRAAAAAVGLFAPAGELPSLEGIQYSERVSAVPVVILTDGRTKGPAELFASLMKSHGGAIVIGEDTAGEIFPKMLVALAKGGALIVPQIPPGLEDIPREKVCAAIKCPVERIPFQDIQKDRDAYKKDPCVRRAVEIVICVDALSPR